jgi:hypothetical protein
MSLIDDLKPQIAAALKEALGEALDCTRVWEAWSVGTMSADDFALVAEDEDRLSEIVEAVLAPVRAALPTSQ